MHRRLTVLSFVFLLATIALPTDLRADGNVQKVNHIIIAMPENHSFDNYFGALAYAPGTPYHNANGACLTSDHRCVDGLSCAPNGDGSLSCSNSNLDDDGSTVVRLP